MTTETWEQDTEQAWEALQAGLAEWLGGEPGDDTVVIELSWPEDELDGAAPYVQLFIEDDVFVHAEAVSNHFLDERFRLDKARRKVLRGLGWQRPSDDTDNYWCEREVPEDAESLAGLLVQTLRDVFGVPAPAFLSVGAFSSDGSLAEEETPFGLSRTTPVGRPVDLTAVKAEGPDHLRDLAAAALAPVLEGGVEFDPDGDIPVPAGNTVIYVRVEEGAPAIRLFAWLLRDVKWTPRVGYALNELNKRLNFARLVHHDGHIMVSAQLLCLPFVPEALRHAVVGLTTLVDGLDLTVQERIGGLLMSEGAAGEDA